MQMLDPIAGHIIEGPPHYEKPMPLAQPVSLPDGQCVMPQHYLQYCIDESALSDILANCYCFDNVLLFANHDEQGLFLQVGIIGHENYDRTAQFRPKKIVYGRRWRIEPNTPTSEVIQTAFLAIDKALEHEVRELLTIEPEGYEGKVSAPFSCHQDMSAIVLTMKTLLAKAERNDGEHLHACAARVKFGQRPITITSVVDYNQKTIVEVKLGTPPVYRQLENELPDFNNLTLTLILDSLQTSAFLHQLMDAIIYKSHQLTRESFLYKGVARFSYQLHPEKLAKLSIDTRPYARDQHNSQFLKVFERLNYDADDSKVPTYGCGKLADENRKRVNEHPNLHGHLPKPNPVNLAR